MKTRQILYQSHEHTDLLIRNLLQTRLLHLTIYEINMFMSYLQLFFELNNQIFDLEWDIKLVIKSEAEVLLIVCFVFLD